MRKRKNAIPGTFSQQQKAKKLKAIRDEEFPLESLCVDGAQDDTNVGETAEFKINELNEIIKTLGILLRHSTSNLIGGHIQGVQKMFLRFFK